MITWIEEAKKHIGTREIPGAGNEPKIVKWFKAIQNSWFNTDLVPWCAAFLGACFEAVGIKSTRKATAKSYLDWGVPLAAPCFGCVAVFLRDGGGHVGFVLGQDKRGRLMVLGGNQGDAVSVAPFDRARAAGYRYPTGYTPDLSPLPLYDSSAASSTNEA